MSHYSKISSCRVCKSRGLRFLEGFGDLAISDFTDVPSEGTKVPLNLVLCPNCTLVQLEHDPPSELLYRDHYWYKSGMNQVIVDDLKDIVKKSLKECPLKKGEMFLDIGANDGTLLSFVPSRYYRVGVEPAQNLIKALIQHCTKAVSGFWETTKLDKKAKIITAIGMFYDAIDPNIFVSKVKENLEEDGLFVAQMMTLKPMVEKNDVGNICHEHIEYYSYKSLVELYERNGLEIYKVEENNINGGSYRLYARHKDKGSIEFEESYDIAQFIENIKKNRAETMLYIKEQVAQGKKVYLYAASTKGNTILQYYGLDSELIEGAAEKDKTKWGKYTVATNIPIIDEKEAKKLADVFFVLPFGFIDSFVEKEKRFLQKGGKMFVCTPQFKVYEDRK